MISAEELADVFVEVADTLVADFDLVDFLYNMCERAAVICNAKAVGILLADEQGELRYVAGSTEQAGLVELLEMQASEGPCYDAFREHRQIINTDLNAARGQWPKFAPRAIEEGFASVHAIPLRLRQRTIGAANIFGHVTGRFEPTDIRIIQALADVATISILQERAVQRGNTLTEQLQQAMFGRIVIEQAKGALSRLLEVSPDQAFTLMRKFARESGQRLGDVARAVIEDPNSIPTLTKPT
jgi:GAF domain-containing protein